MKSSKQLAQLTDVPSHTSTTAPPTSSPAVTPQQQDEAPTSTGIGTNISGETSTVSSLDRSHEHAHKLRHHAPPSSMHPNPTGSLNSHISNENVLPITREGSQPARSGFADSRAVPKSLGMGLAPSGSAGVTMAGQLEFGRGQHHQSSYPGVREQREVMGVASSGDHPGESEDLNDAVFSPSSMDDERMMIIEKVSTFTKQLCVQWSEYGICWYLFEALLKFISVFKQPFSASSSTMIHEHKS